MLIVLGLLHCELDNGADMLEVHAASIFKVDV
jgi:hypothetical protein